MFLVGTIIIWVQQVQLAKAAHFRAHLEANSRAGPATYFHSRKRRDVYGGYNIPVIGPNGVPVETPEVQAAKANHFAALAEASTRVGPATHYAGKYYLFFLCTVIIIISFSCTLQCWSTRRRLP